MDIDILYEDDRWLDIGFDQIAHDAFVATCGHLGIKAELCEVSILACDDSRISLLNQEFRGKAQPTNVLSWPADDLAAETAGELPHPPEPDLDGEIVLGDIAIAFDTCQSEASEADKPLSAHVTHLVVHGTLHLLGYDHIRDPDATLMQGIETEILGKMGLDDPYRI